MIPRWMAILFSVLLIGLSAEAHAARLDSVRDLAGRVGPIIGSALSVPGIARARIEVHRRKIQRRDQGGRVQ